MGRPLQSVTLILKNSCVSPMQVMNQNFADPNQDVIAKAKQKVQEQAKKQGYKPVKTPEELIGDFWPEDESIDEFVLAIRNLRQAEILGITELFF